MGLLKKAVPAPHATELAALMAQNATDLFTQAHDALVEANTILAEAHHADLAEAESLKSRAAAAKKQIEANENVRMKLKEFTISH